MDIEHWQNRAIYVLCFVALALAILVPLSDAGAILQTTGNIAGGIVGAMGAYIAVRATIAADRRRDDENRRVEADRVQAALSQELRHYALRLYYIAVTFMRTGSAHEAVDAMREFPLPEPIVFRAMCGRLDLLPIQRVRCLVALYTEAQHVGPRLFRFDDLNTLQAKKEFFQYIVWFGRLCSLAAPALEELEIDVTVGEQKSLRAELERAWRMIERVPNEKKV